MTVAQPGPRPTEGAPLERAPLKSVPAAAGPASAGRPRPRLSRPRLTRRGLQIALGVAWLLDGALQFQPFMLGKGFGEQVISPAGDGQPAFVAVPVHWAAGVIAAHPVAWDVPFALIQLLLGLGMLYPRTVKAALAASLPWVLGVWYLGEGLGGIASGNASLLTGAPGAVLLYGVLALAAWPRDDGRPDVPPARWLAFTWAALWAGGAILQGLPANNSGAAADSAISGGASAVPGWLGTLDTSVGAWFAHHGGAVYALIAVEALIGLAVLVPKTALFSATAGLVLAAAIWLVPENFGQIPSGHATDLNSAPLIALTAIALLASHSRSIQRPTHPGTRGLSDHHQAGQQPGVKLTHGLAHLRRDKPQPNRKERT
jgi:hypothetical protein